ncbi:MAG: glutathione transferase GstA [Deltaproteobacteria bacterium]|nr:MAG: glutathione transferase GstA [Deltaproteobacteria bacterium]
MKLYYSPGACSLSPHIVAREAKLPVKLVKVDLQTKQTEAGADFRQINVNGYVPALELEDGLVLTEGPAIIQYLADQVPAKKLAPENGTLERYLLQQQLNFISTELHKGFGTLFNPDMPEAAKNLARKTLRARFDTLANQLVDRPYLMGADFTVADAYLFVVLSWTGFLDFDLAPWTVLQDYSARIAQRPAVQQALQEEGLTE